LSSNARWTLICVLLAPAVVLPLLVGIYDKNDPELWGFPFYYWFQFLLIPIAAVLTTIAYRLSKADDKADDKAGERRK
jgi:hypothetical protein